MKKCKYRNLKFFVVFFSILSLTANPTYPLFTAQAAAPTELQTAINQKSKEFQEISSKILETQKNLETAQGQRKSLQHELGKIDTTINSLTLNIKSSEVLLDKLGLEIDYLAYDIGDITETIDRREEAILKTLQALQSRGHDSPLTILLKNETLTDSVSEMQNLLDLNNGLESELNALKQAKENLANKLQDTSSKKKNIEVEHKNLQSKKVILADTKKEKQTILVQTKNQEQAYQKSLSELEKKQTEIALQIETLEKQLRQNIDTSALPSKRSGVLGEPVLNSRLTQEYGATKFAQYGYRGKWHNGIDYGAPVGTPILAAESGRVIAVGDQDRYCYRGAYGKFIVIAHDNNLTTLYAHLSLSAVSENAKVERGQVIGYVGRSGYATGPHLHFTVYASPTVKIAPSKSCGPKMPYGGDLNPLDYL